MKVGIDTFGCNHGKSGIGSYLSFLCENLHNSENIEFELFGAEIDRYTFGADSGLGFAAVPLPDSRKIKRAWHYTCASIFAKKRKYDAVLYAAGAHYIPLFFLVPGVAVVNDVVSELYASEIISSKVLRVLVGLRNAPRIIAASQFIRDDLVKLGIDRKKITVIHNGVDHSVFFPREMISSEYVNIKPFAIQRPYFIYPSRLTSATKKHIELIKAFSIFKQKTKLPHRLVFAGSEGDYSKEVREAVMTSPYSSDIFMTGFFPHEDFPLLYCGSEGCVFPSVNEGVGMSVLEAMASGVPVACSSAGALAEVAGSNAIFFDSDNIEEIASSLETLACDSERRKSLIAGGIEWTKRFSWEHTAEKTVEVLKELAAKNKKAR